MRTTLALFLASVLVAPPTALAVETATLTGRLLSSVDGHAIAKAVWVGGISAAVKDDGTFRVVGIPAGLADLAIETSEGLYVVSTPIAIAPGTTRSVQLAFGGREDTGAPAPPNKDKTKKKGGVWANPVAATAIVLGSAIVVGVAIDQSTKSTPASPSMP